MKESFEKQAWKLNEFCAAHGIGRSKAYEEIAGGRLKAFKVGRLTLITREAAQEWLRACQETSATATKLVPGGA